MAVVFDWLNDTNLTLASAAEALYTNAASTVTSISRIILHNRDSSSRTVTLYCVPDSSGNAGTAATGNQIYKEDLEANETVVLSDMKLILGDEGDSIQGLGSSADVVNIFIFGAKKT